MIHKALGSERIRGEWFKPSKKVFSYLNSSLRMARRITFCGYKFNVWCFLCDGIVFETDNGWFNDETPKVRTPNKAPGLKFYRGKQSYSVVVSQKNETIFRTKQIVK
jgi:hypothetical protein